MILVRDQRVSLNGALQYSCVAAEQTQQDNVCVALYETIDNYCRTDGWLRGGTILEGSDPCGIERTTTKLYFFSEGNDL